MSKKSSLVAGVGIAALSISALFGQLQANAMTSPCGLPYAVNVPVAGPCENFDVSISWLYLRPGYTAFPYAEEITIANDEIVSSSFEPYHFDWSSGFEIAAGYNLPCDSWRLGLSWTYYHNSGHDNHNHLAADVAGTGAGRSGVVVYPAFEAFNIPELLEGETLATGIDARAKCTINEVDLTMGRAFRTGCAVSLDAFFGLRWLQIKDEFAYDWAAFVQETPELSTVVFYGTESKVHALGIVSGFDAGYHFTESFRFVGKSSVALLCGKHTNDTFYLDSNVEGVEALTSSFSYWGMIPELSLFLGVEWKSGCGFGCFSDIFVTAGWDNRYYFDTVSFITAPDGGATEVFQFGHNSNFYLTGLKLSVGLGF